MTTSSSPSSPSAGSSGQQDGQRSTTFELACACLNARVECQSIAGEEMPSSSGQAKGTRRVRLQQRSEIIKQPAYVSWDVEDVRPGRRSSVINEASESAGPAWRTCWICKTRLYKAEEKRRDSPASIDSDVTVDLASGVIWGEKLDGTLNERLLPFSSLALTLPKTSSFGKPPPDPLTVYPRLGSPAQQRRLHYIPPLPDPFFLPPPFIPSHPHLRDLCDHSIEYLKERHARFEAEVQNFIAQKSNEMRHLEDTVRKEVEVLWERYQNVPGVSAELDRSRSRSMTRESSDGPDRKGGVGQSFTPTESSIATPGESTRPPVHAASPPPVGSSLLSASISANSFHAPPPPQVAKDRIDDSISEASKKFDTKSDARAVAMSYVFSSLDEAMAERPGRQRSSSVAEQVKKGSGNRSGDVASESSDDKDSWIDEERKLLADEEGGTPKAKKRQHSVGKKAVKFTEPLPEEDPQPATQPADKGPNEGDKDHDEYVFDFELDENNAEKETAPHRDISRTRDMIEANLSTTFAADAPSHRAAWRVRGVSGSQWSIPKSRQEVDEDEDQGDESQISQLAQSMPMAIASRRDLRAARQLPEMERKTSWSDRQELVPPLRAAMRQLGISASIGKGHPVEEPPRRASRSASASREREDARSYKQDPGAVFEALADEVEDDDEEDEEGTLRESGFIPPHVAARRHSNGEGPEVGWRSLISD